MTAKLVLFLLLFLKCISGTSSTYYFSSSIGDDSRSAEEAKKPDTPWKSIEKLNTLLKSIKPGDSILFKNNDKFHGTINIIRSGTLKSPIYFGCFGSGEKPIISGFRDVTNWNHNGENLYEAYLPDITTPLNMLVLNDKIQAMGRYPNLNNQNGGYLKINSYKDGHITTSKLPTNSNYSGGEIVIRKNNWIIDRHLIKSNSQNSLEYNNFEEEIPPMIGYGFFIQNHPLTLDQHGEWYFDKGAKKISIYLESDPSNEKIKIATLPEVISFQNKTSNIIFENISIEGSNFNLISLSGSSNLKFENCNLEYIGENGIHTVSSRNIAISNTSIRNSLNGGIFLGWNDLGMVIQNSTIENIFNFAGMGKNGEMQGQGIYMSETSSDILIEKSKFLNCGYNAINFSGNNISIKNNLIDTFCFIKDDGAGIYTFTGPAKTPFVNRKIIGNIIINGIGAVSGTKPYGVNDYPYVEGIYLDTFVSGVDIENNSIINIKSKGIFLNNAKNINISNNKILNTGYSIYLKSDKLENYFGNISVHNNEFLALTKSQIHYHIETKINDLSKIGNFDKNILSKPINNTSSIYLSTPSKKDFIDLNQWKKNYGFDQNSSNGPEENLQMIPPELKLADSDASVFFDYNSTSKIKAVNLSGTFVDLNGIDKNGKVEIPPYSSIILLKSKKTP
jgi:hypothetical protein